MLDSLMSVAETSVINVIVKSQSPLQIMKVKKFFHCLHIPESPLIASGVFGLSPVVKPCNFAYVNVLSIQPVFRVVVT